jgi:hypothetical protein
VGSPPGQELLGVITFSCALPRILHVIPKIKRLGETSVAIKRDVHQRTRVEAVGPQRTMCSHCGQ